MTNNEKIMLAYIAAHPGENMRSTGLGLSFADASDAMQSLVASGAVEWRKVPSKSGKTMQEKLFATA